MTWTDLHKRIHTIRKQTLHRLLPAYRCTHLLFQQRLHSLRFPDIVRRHIRQIRQLYLPECYRRKRLSQLFSRLF